jgi:hypothetical protein
MKSLIIAIIALSASAQAASAGSAVKNKLNQPEASSHYYISTDTSAETLDMFYTIACREYSESNFGSSIELLEKIVKKTDAYPMSYYLISKIYRDVATLQDYKKSSSALLKFIEQAKKKKMHSSFITSSYDDLIDMEKSPEECLKYALAALAVGEDIMSNQCMVKAAEKMVMINGDKEYLEMFSIYVEKNLKIFQRNINAEFMDADTPQLRDKLSRIANND